MQPADTLEKLGFSVLPPKSLARVRKALSTLTFFEIDRSRILPANKRCGGGDSLSKAEIRTVR